MDNLEKLTVVPGGNNVIDGRDRFLQKQIEYLVELKDQEIFFAAAQLLFGEKVNPLDLVNFDDFDNDNNVVHVDIAPETAIGVLEQLRKRFNADNKDGRQEDDGTVIWTGRFYRGDIPLRISTVESYALVDELFVPISAMARIYSSKILSAERLMTKHRHPTNYHNNAR